jgi:predicted amidohydrolase YtcJ
VRTALFELIPQSDRSEAIHAALRAATSKGIGMVHELGAPHISPAGDFALIDALDGVLPEVVGYWGELDTAVALELGLAGAAGDLCMDGAIGSRTAALHTPYSDEGSTAGHLYLTADQVAEHVLACTEVGLQAGFHVIGDRAVAEVVAGFQLAADKVGAPAIVMGRHRLEHLEMVDLEQLRILSTLGVTASVQPMFDGLWGGSDELYQRRLGERARPMNPFASMNRAGMALAFGSDTPVTPFDPWGAIRAAAWHHNEGERVTVRAAFNAHTRGGWRAARRDEGGVIAVGAPASIAVFDVPGDLVVQTPDDRVAAWSTDTRAGVPLLPGVHPDDDLPTCTLTLVNGEVAHDKLGVLE